MTFPNRRTWTDEMSDKLVDMHKAGAPFSKIAKAVGVSRNAAIGRANRLGLLNRAQAGWKIQEPWAPRLSAPKVRPTLTNSGAEPRPHGARRNPTRSLKSLLVESDNPASLDPCSPAPDSLMLGYFEPNAGCRYIFGDERDIFNVRVCGAPSFQETSYCAHHYRLCHSRDNGHLGDSRPDLAAQNRRAAPSPIVLAVLSDREDRAA